MMRLIVMLLALATACVHPTELTPDERAAGNAAFTAWREAGLPEPDQGRCDVRNFQVRIASDAEFFGLCHTAPELAYGCMHWDSSGEWFRWREIPVVVIAPWWKSEPSIIVHELQHALVRCSGIGPLGSPGDSKHSLPQVWADKGGPASSQARAMALLSGQSSTQDSTVR